MYSVGDSIFSEESSRGHCQTKDTGLDGPQVSTSVLLQSQKKVFE